MSLNKLVFDTTDANTIADSHSVGAYLRASDGTLLTHTDVAGKKALDVRIAEGINVEVDLDAADDSVAAYLNDGSGNAIGSTGGAIHISDAGGSLTVDAINLDIRDLVAASDSVQSNLFDGAGTAITSTLIGSNQSLDVNVVASLDVALANSAVLASASTLTAAATAEKVIASNLASRKYLSVYNNDNRTVYIGGSGVDAASGFPLSPGSYMELRAGDAVDVYYDSAKSGHAIRVLELS